MTNINKTHFLVRPEKKVRLSDYDPADTSLMPDKDKVKVEIQKDLDKMADLQDRFYAEHQRALLIVLQGMDTSGKDGTIKHVMKGVNPLGSSAFSFKAPTGEELDHDFLWRFERAMPRRGHIGVFNRSHYEDVLIVRVHQTGGGEGVEGTLRSDQSVRATGGRIGNGHSEVLPSHQQRGAEEAPRSTAHQPQEELDIFAGGRSGTRALG